MPLQLKSVTALSVNADQLIRAYAEFAGDGGLVEQTTNEAHGPKYLIELRALRSHVSVYRDRAAQIMAEATFSQLDQDVQDDIRLIAEECAIAIEELDDEVVPDKKWVNLSENEKHEATDRLRASGDAVKTVRARLRHERRGLPASGQASPTKK